jgi:hypothetical protein
LTSFIDEIPFSVYGLSGDLGPRQLAGHGRAGETVNLVALGHGDGRDISAPWVQVTVVGPLSGGAGRQGEPGVWRMDPLPMVMGELLNAAGAEFKDGAALQRAVDALVDREPTSQDLLVDGRLMRFRTWFQGRAWAATGGLADNHMLYVTARNVDSAEVELSSDVDIRQYETPSAE